MNDVRIYNNIFHQCARHGRRVRLRIDSRFTNF